MPDASFIPNANALAWADALESDRFTQGQGALCRRNPDGSEAACCLGVACILAVEAGVELPVQLVDDGTYAFLDGTHEGASDHTGSLPDRIVEWLGLRDPGGNYGGTDLIHDNDVRGLSFEEIAKIVRTEPRLYRAR